MADSIQRDPLDVLAQEFAERFRRGEQPSIEEYASRYPELSDQLRDILPPVAMLEAARRRKLGSSAAAPAPRLERLGDFRIIREIGRGGMGIVYEAFQDALGRRVALKILPRHALLERRQIERFEREAQAAARLHHTNIVPVFGVGEAEGLRYYVMQLIDGEGLDIALARLRRSNRPGDTNRSAQPTRAVDTPSLALPSVETSFETPGASGRPIPPPIVTKSGPSWGADYGQKSYWRRVAELGRQVADALQFAHQQGTLHRDIKPANLIIDPQGQTWVTDFGLAKLAEHDNLTRAGDIVGTLDYLPPEGLKGQADARGDVYSLGMSLYELVTLARPFGESQPAQLLQQIASQAPPAPRKTNPAIPRDLETIILKAISRDPAHRYATAGALADDLQRFLEDRPIEARRTAPLQRAWRTCRRNPLNAALGGAAIGALVLAAVVGWLGYGRARAALAREQAATELAEKNVKLSLAAFEEIFVELTPDELERPPIPLGDELRPPAPPESEANAALVESVIKFYDRFAEQNETNAELQLESARVHRHIGDLRRRLGQTRQANEAYLSAAATYEKLVAQNPEDSERAFELADTLLAEEPPVLLGTSRDPAALTQAIDRYRRALTLAEGLPASIDRRWEHIELAAQAHGKLAPLYEELHQYDDALREYRQAIETIAPQAHGQLERGLRLAQARYALANYLARRKQNGESRQTLEESITELTALVDRRPPRGGRRDGRGERQGRHLLATHYETLASVLRSLGDEAAAKTAQSKADVILDAIDDGPPRDGRDDGPPREGPPGGGPPGGGPNRPRRPGPPENGPPDFDDRPGPPPPRRPDGPPRRGPNGERPPEDRPGPWSPRGDRPPRGEDRPPPRPPEE